MASTMTSMPLPGDSNPNVRMTERSLNPRLAFAASGPHHRGEVKISKYAYDKRVRFKGVEKNHLTSQVMGYRIGDPDATKRADDLYDTYVYGVAMALGDKDGH